MKILNSWIDSIDPFVTIVPFLYPLKTSENPTVFWCFQGLEKSALGTNRYVWITILYGSLGLVIVAKSCELSEFKRINGLLYPVKLLENHWFSDDCKVNRSELIRLN